MNFVDMQQYPGESKKDEPRIKEESTAELLRESVDYEPQRLGPIAKSQVGGLSTIIITNSENNSLGKDVSPTLKASKLSPTEFD